jgi:hypothetical protein
MEVNGDLHALAVLSPGKGFSASIVEKTGWIRERWSECGGFSF